MAKLHPTLCALSLIAATSFAQQPTIAPPCGVAPAPDATSIVTLTCVGAAPIEPPLCRRPQGASGAFHRSDATFAAGDALPPAVTTRRFHLPPLVSTNFKATKSAVLRTLARQAGQTIIVTDKVSTTAGTVTARIENKTPMQAIGIIVDSKG
jgi:hypothetical protein